MFHWNVHAIRWTDALGCLWVKRKSVIITILVIFLPMNQKRTIQFLLFRITILNFVLYFLRPEGSHIWLNRVRKANSTVWTNDRECETGRSITEHVHGNDINSTQCLALNMTSPNDVQHLLFAAPCEDQMKFVCILFKGNVSGNLFASCLWLCFLKSLLISSVFIF